MSLSDSLAEAVKNPIEGLPRMAAVIVFRNGRRVVGYNSRKSHPLQKKFAKNPKSLCLHAEIDALVKASRLGLASDLPAASMYVSRVKKDGSVGLAKPCPGCQKALIAFNLENVEWTE